MKKQDITSWYCECLQHGIQSGVALIHEVQPQRIHLNAIDTTICAQSISGHYDTKNQIDYVNHHLTFR